MSQSWRRVDRVGAGCLLLMALAALALLWWPAAPGQHERLITTAFGIGVYLTTFLVSSLLFASAMRHALSWANALRRVWGWIVRWHGLVAIGLGAGALVGALLYGIGGPLLGFEGSVPEFIRRGAADGAFYLLIWCPGGALIWCFMQAFGPKNAPESS